MTRRRSDIEGPQRGLRREMAANYIGVSPNKFDEWVQRGIMPKPKRQDGVVVWDVLRLDSAFDALPNDGEEAAKKGGSSWDP